jgi:hypothetical protein
MSGKRYTESSKLMRSSRSFSAAIWWPMWPTPARHQQAQPLLVVAASQTAVPVTSSASALDDVKELRRFRAELKRVNEERDILKKPPRTLPRDKGKVRPHARACREFLVSAICRVLRVHRSESYAWLQ